MTSIVTPPSYRFDLAIEEDFVEEIARIHGYAAIPASIGRHGLTMLPAPEMSRAPSALQARLVDRGWQEVVTFSFVDSTLVKRLDPAAAPPKLMNPIAAQLDVMRPSLLPGLLGVLGTAVARKVTQAAIFEMGSVFVQHDGWLAQPLHIGGIAFGRRGAERWADPARNVDFFDLKGDLEALASPKKLTTARGPHPALHPGRSAVVRVDGVAAGFLGELHPRICANWTCPRRPSCLNSTCPLLATCRFPRAARVALTGGAARYRRRSR